MHVNYLPIAWLLFLFSSCHGQDQRAVSSSTADIDPVAAQHQKMPAFISSIDTSPGWRLPAQQLLITGTIFHPDGITPAENVTLYYYQTNHEGRYLHVPAAQRSMPPNEQGQTHGYIRGWVKTGKDGRYAIYTTRPGSYPDFPTPAHIHITIHEPGNGKAYYVDDMVFDDDPLLNSKERQRLENRGGAGVLRLMKKGNLQVGERNIILGLNIPGYKTDLPGILLSGRKVGEDVMSFTPFHAWGPDKGTKACPVCKYGRYHGILFFVGNQPDWPDIKKWLLFFEEETNKRGNKLKAYFIYGSEKGYDKILRENELSELGEALKLQKVALTYLPSFADRASDIYLNKINPAAENSFLLYKHSNIIGNFVNLKATEANFQQIRDCLDRSVNEYFNLP